MSEDQTSSPGPDPGLPSGGAAAPPPVKSSVAASSGSLAEEYIAAEVTRARKSLLITRIGSIVLLLVFGGGLTYITSGFAKALEPHAAAEIADGLISSQVNEKGPDIANRLKEKIPELIAQTPDYVLREIPNYRGQLEDRVEQELTKYGQSTSEQLGTRLDAYLTAHKDEIKGMMSTSNDPAALKQLGPSFKQELLTYIKETPQGGESIMSQIDQSLSALQEIATKVRRLSNGKGLTPQEAKTRNAIAILARAIEAQRANLTSNP